MSGAIRARITGSTMAYLPLLSMGKKMAASFGDSGRRGRGMLQEVMKTVATVLIRRDQWGDICLMKRA